MKKIISLSLSLLLMALILSGCTTQDPTYYSQTLQSTPDKVIGMISSFDTDQQTFDLDTIELVDPRDYARVKELGIIAFDIPTGYYIHNADELASTYTFTDETLFRVYCWDTTETAYQYVTRDYFMKQLGLYPGYQPPYWVEVEDGIVTQVTEQYIP